MELSLRNAAKQCGSQLAVVTEAGALSYAELYARVAATSAELTRRGYGRSSLLAIRASNRLQTLLAIYACIELGIPFVVIHPRLQAQEVATLVRAAQPSCLLEDAEVDALTNGTGAAPPGLGADLAPSLPLAVLYSSGTTGTPKGAILSRAALVASADASAHNLGWTADDRWLLCLPLCHIGGLSIVIRCLLARRPLILLPRYDANAVLAAITRHRATLLSVVPTMLHGLLDADAARVLRSLRAVLVGGAATPFSLVLRAVAAKVNVLTTYGLTEACSQVTVQKWTPVPQARRGSGTPLVGLSLSIRDQKGQPLPPGSVGRIFVQGKSLMTGYLGQPPLGGGWFDTEDIGEIDREGVLYVHARRMDLIVTGGENVYPIEVEQTLLSVPGVRAAIVFGVSDPVWGAVVAAALVVESGFTQTALEDVLKSRLAPFKRPRLWTLVDAIPELPNGKLDRRRASWEFTPRLAKQIVHHKGQDALRT